MFDIPAFLSSFPGHHAADFARDALEDLAPVPAAGLAEQPRRAIPRRILPINHPAPVRHMLEGNPHRAAEGAGEVCGHSIAGNDEI